MASLINYQVASTLTQMPAGKRENGRVNYRPAVCTFVLLAADCLAMIAAAVIVSWCMASNLTKAGDLFVIGGLAIQRDLAAVFVVTVLYLAIKGRYCQPIPFWTEARLVVYACGAQAVFGLLTIGIPSFFPVFMVLLIFPLVAIPTNRLAKCTLSSIGLWTHPVVVIGDGPSGYRTALESDHSLGYRFVGQVSPDDVLGASAGHQLRPLLNRYSARRLLIIVSGERQQQLIECALRERVPFALMPSHILPAFPFEQLCLFSQDVMLLSFRGYLSQPVARTTKIAFDVLLAAVILVITSPLFLVIFITNWLQRSPTIFAHRRVGMRGKSFNCLKFRTMVANGDQVLSHALARDPSLAAEWATTRKLVNDPRITRVGRFLRKTSLDELPQLVNVLRLEMSLVGPRPVVSSEVPFYGEDIALYYTIRPGLTGLWQVSGRSNLTYARRVQLDAWYVNNWTIWQDIVVLLKTFPAVLRSEGAR